MGSDRIKVYATTAALDRIRQLCDDIRDGEVVMGDGLTFQQMAMRLATEVTALDNAICDGEELPIDWEKQ